MRSIFFFFFLFCFFQYHQAEAQLQIQLLEKGTKKILSGRAVYILPSKEKVTTDNEGVATLPNVDGDSELVINIANYQKLQRKIGTNNLKRKTPLILYLELQDGGGFRTIIRSKVEKRDFQTKSLEQDEFLTMPGSFGGDPVRAIQNQPGVAVSGANAQIIIQGASPDDTGYTINKHRVPLVFHFGGLSSVIIPEAVQRVDLSPSGYGPEYSNAIGGLVGLTTKDPRKDQKYGMVYADFFNVGGFFEGPLDDKSSLLFGYRYSYVGQVLKKVAEKEKDLQLTAAPTFMDLTTLYRREITPTTEFKATLVASRDELELVFNRAINDDPSLNGNFYNRTQFFRFIPEVKTRFSSTSFMEHSLGIGRDELLVNISSRYLDIKSNGITHRSEWVNEWSPFYKTYIGLDNEWDTTKVGVNLPNNYNVGGVGNPFSVGEEKKFTTEGSDTLIGVYLRQEIRPRGSEGRWVFLPNIRYDYFSEVSESIIEPRPQVRYQFTNGLTIQASAGKYAQVPRPQESSKDYGNASIRAPFAWHYNLGWSYDFRKGGTDGLEVTQNFFYKTLHRLIIPDITANYSNKGEGTIKGGELQLKWRKGRFGVQAVYTYLDSERKIPGFGTFPSEFDQTHNLNFIGNYQFEKWTIGGRFRFVSGSPYTSVLGASFDANNDVYIPRRGRLYSERFKNFHQLDIRIDRRFVFDTWILTAYLDIQNVYNSKNEQSIEYSYNYTQSEKIKGLPILPTLGLKGEF
jgi:hypothetical protein